MPERTIHFPPVGSISGIAPAMPAAEYLRPDITILGSIIASSEQIRAELKVVGDEKRYATALRIMKAQGMLIAKLADELLARYEQAGVGKEGNE